MNKNLDDSLLLYSPQVWVGRTPCHRPQSCRTHHYQCCHRLQHWHVQLVKPTCRPPLHWRCQWRVRPTLPNCHHCHHHPCPNIVVIVVTIAVKNVLCACQPPLTPPQRLLQDTRQPSVLIPTPLGILPLAIQPLWVLTRLRRVSMLRRHLIGQSAQLGSQQLEGGFTQEAVGQQEAEALVDRWGWHDKKQHHCQPDKRHERGHWQQKLQQLQLRNNQQKEMRKRCTCRLSGRWWCDGSPGGVGSAMVGVTAMTTTTRRQQWQWQQQRWALGTMWEWQGKR